MLPKKRTPGNETASRRKLVPPLALLKSQIFCLKSQAHQCLPPLRSMASWMAVQEFAPGISYEAEAAVSFTVGKRSRLEIPSRLGLLTSANPLYGEEAGWTDRWMGKQCVGSTWQNGAFTLSWTKALLMSYSGQGCPPRQY